MPVYPFKCPMCGDYKEVVRPVSDCAAPEMCLKCDATMERQYTAPMIEAPWFDYYDQGLGRNITSKQDIQRAKSDYKRATGHNMVEVGTDAPMPYAPKRKEFDFPRGAFDNAITE
jgi:putative FmdB family regulatory protein